MQKFVLICIAVFISAASHAQQKDSLINYLVKILSVLASDSLEGRANYTPSLHKAAMFVASEMKQEKLVHYHGTTSYLHPFSSLYGKRKAAPVNGIYNPDYVLFNVIGVIPGRSKTDEAIIFSAHYDHVGSADGIYNGANDNASGVAVMLAIMKYYAETKSNERTLIFCAFAGEELGMHGSQEFVSSMDRKTVKAVINLEMLGRTNAVGLNSFMVIGEDRSNLDEIFKKNLEGSGYTIEPESNVLKKLDERSDHFPFSQKGVIAHTIMSSDDDDPCYHKPCDEIQTLDIANMSRLVEAIVMATSSIVDGIDTPKRR
jgi:hypothetical protein